MSQKEVHPGDWIVAVGGRTGRDGIHGATFSSAELTQESEVVSGGAVQIGNAVMEKMVMDVILQARDRQLFRGITDCGAGGFSSAVGEMGEETGAEVWLDRAPLKYSGLSYTEIWISEAQERMVLAVPPEHWEEFQQLCLAEGVEATIIGQFTQTQELVLKYQEQEVGRLPMSFLHGGRPPVVRDAVYQLPANTTVAGKAPPATRAEFEQILLDILRSPNVCSKEWIIRQYDHEVQAGSVIKPLVGVAADGPGDAAVVRPRLTSSRGLVVGCGINPHLGDCDPYWMAAAAIDEAVRNCVAVGADPARIALLDNFCWGNTEHPETLGTLVRAALGCHDTAIAYGTPFVSGKDSLNNNFRYVDERGVSRTVTIPSTLLITALGQVAEIETCVTMDLKEPGNLLYQIGSTYSEWGGSHYHLVRGESGGEVPRVDFHQAPKTFAAVHAAIQAGTIRSCHDLSEGGLAVALAEMAFAGGYGAAISLAAFGKLDEPTVLFAESNTRFVVEVPPEREAEFLRIVPGAFRLGTVIERAVLEVSSLDGTRLVDLPLDRLKTAWQETLRG
jgi:phosphoribosylformylglycinamidine synthase